MIENAVALIAPLELLLDETTSPKIMIVPHGGLVTLCACESGRSQVIGGDEIIGLTRAFLVAGAATLVVSLWPGQDDTTADLITTWYAQLRQPIGRLRLCALLGWL